MGTRQVTKILLFADPMCLWAHFADHDFADQNRVCAGAIGSGFRPSHTRLSLSVFSLCLSLALSLSVSRSVSVCLSLASNTQREGSCHALGAPLRAACRHRTRRKPRHMTTRVPTPRALPTQIRTLLTACARARAQRACLQAAPLTLAASAHCLCLYHAQLRARSAARRHAGRGTRSATTAASCNCSFVRSIDGKRSQARTHAGPSLRHRPAQPLSPPAAHPARVDSALRHHFVHGQPQVRPVTRRWSHCGLRLDDLRDLEEAVVHLRRAPGSAPTPPPPCNPPTSMPFTLHVTPPR